MKLLKTLFFLLITPLVTAILFLSVNQVNGAASNHYLTHFSFDKKDTIKKDTLKVSRSKDTVTSVTDTIHKVTLKKKEGSLSSKVNYTAQDSILADLDGKYLYLYKDASVTYENLTLKADFIRIDQKTMTVYAKGLKDSTGVYAGRPFFTGTGNDVIADSLAYNFKSKKAKVWAGVSSEGEGFIRGGQMKLNEEKEGFLKNGIYTTCNDPSHVHYGIEISKAKVAQNRIITGPAHLFIEDIPIPIILPFGFFPKTSKRSNGILFPSVGEDAEKGFFMRGLGYYVGLGDYMDLAFQSSLFTNGSYDLDLSSRYNVRYDYSGNFALHYSNQKFGEPGTVSYSNTRDFHVNWSHTQSSTATGSTFSASVNAGTSKYYQNTGNYIPLNQRFNNTLQSSVSYSKAWLGTPFNLSTAFTHSQEINTGVINLGFPSLAFTVSRINPFDSKRRVGPQKWYNKIGLSYNLQFDNQLSTFDSLLFKKNTLDTVRSGIKHTIPISTSFTIAKNFFLTPSINYNEYWYFKTLTKAWNPQANRVDNINNYGFSTARDYGFSTGLSTKLFGIKEFKKTSGIRAIRHVLTPTLAYFYRPDFGSDKYGYYKTVQSDSLGRTTTYSIFENSLYGGPARGTNNSLSFSLDNILEMKVRSKKDTINGEQKISILEGLSFSTNYNFAADSFKLAPINFSGRTTLFKKVYINFGGILDPYYYTSTGRRVNEYSINRNGKLVSLTSGFFSLSSSFNSKSKRTAPISPQQYRDLTLIEPNPNNFIDFDIPWNFSVNYFLNYTKTYSISSAKSLSQAINFNGQFSLTPKWVIGFTSGVDITNAKLSPTSLSINRDLHCWDLAMSWTPFGFYKSYSIDLRVKSSILQDLKLSKRSPYYAGDNF
ncbi:putative LPS assembly protein LptD [Solitalea koreensis]|uniref:LPS assembly outer membrane protein LptD (Organic solvent tolerance protein OstA) n=1 Tax=Solitalea koreensis TaxID=543615 RepID=A0A521BBB7_9SPHI|nr:putative LPS assembly protein LptD [Solitalea koreensis]SMO44386.1 LPS assembly outer membrane protein LptD (organic solvent tolerance protein OstA) [Solitalea koreensis]